MNRVLLGLSLSGLGLSAAAANELSPLTPKDLSVASMFLQADWVVKSVMIGLALCSLVTWSVFFAKGIEFRRKSRWIARLTARLGDQPTLAAAHAVQDSTTGLGRAMTAAALEEIGVDRAAEASAVKERIQARLGLIEQAEARASTTGLGVLATIGSVSPFVGLFGTVWGIMNSFIGISKAQTTNLAVVAPGIAEALLATAIGLVAAIPAVVVYNHFTRKLQGQKAQIGQAAGRILILAARDVDRGDWRKAA